MINIAISGAAGRMGKALIQAITNIQDLRLTVALERLGCNALGVDSGEFAGVGSNGIVIESNLAAALNRFEVLIDFSTPNATLANAELCGSAHKRIVIGTTGIDQIGKTQLANIAGQIPIVMAPNMSIGVNLCFKLLDIAATVLGNTTDVEIFEAHHRYKVDAPSGTALHMGEVIANAWRQDLQSIAVYARNEHTGQRTPGTIGFATMRAGDIAGEHAAWFVSEGERVEIVHKATNRANFAQGALRAARWVMQQSPGLYDMQDVLGLRSL
jgi:4-hydroxy-tetrahydrodipicolinate reductase